MDIKEVLCGLETLKFKVSSADGAKVLNQAIKLIVRLDVCNKNAHSKISRLRTDNIALNDVLMHYKRSRDEYADKVMFIASQCDKLQEENRCLKEAEKSHFIINEQCCMCPGAICPGIPGTPHPEPTPCKLWGCE